MFGCDCSDNVPQGEPDGSYYNHILFDIKCLLWHTNEVKKIIEVNNSARKELRKFPRPVQVKFKAMFEILEEEGKLEEPYAKKLGGKDTLFEIRVKYKGQWRAIYAYLSGNIIIILSAFIKKTQKTPLREIEKARKRLQLYKI